MATSNIPINVGTGGAFVATYSVSEDAITKQIQRSVLSDSAGVEQSAIGTTAGAAVTTDVAGTIQQYLRGLAKAFVASVTFLAGKAVDSTNNGMAVSVLQRKTIKRAAGSVTTSGDLIAAVGGKMIKVFVYNLQCNTTATNVKLTDGSVGSQLTCLWNMTANMNIFGGYLSPPDYLFKTTAGNSLYANVSTTSTVQYEITYTDDDAT